MQFDNQKTRNVADAAAKILAGETVSEELKGKQHKIDKNKNGKIDAEDFKLLRKEENVDESCGKDHKKEVKEDKKCPVTGEDECHCEETEQIDEATPSKQQVKQAIGIARDKRYAGGNMTGAMKAMNKINKGLGQHPAVASELKKQNEEAEQLDEYTPDKSGVTKIQGRAYGASKPEKHAVDTMKGPTRKELSAIEKEKKKPFKEMLELYAEKGLKGLSEMTMTEEPDQEQYEKELEQAKKKATQKKTPEEEAGVAKAAVQSVKVEEETELDEGLLDKIAAKVTNHTMNKMAKNNPKAYAKFQKAQAAGVFNMKKEEVEQINERPMTDAEMDKREDIVKGMKKNLKGFKDRYGDRAKDVMYATATKQAMKDED